jgi:Ca2+-transporting ATPase
MIREVRSLIKDVRVLWHCMDSDEVIERASDGPLGLSGEQGAVRLAQYGENRLRQAEKRTLASIFLAQFSDFMIWILMRPRLFPLFSASGWTAASSCLW